MTIKEIEMSIRKAFSTETDTTFDAGNGVMVTAFDDGSGRITHNGEDVGWFDMQTLEYHIDGFFGNAHDYEYDPDIDPYTAQIHEIATGIAEIATRTKAVA